jgi:hypothetical protein
MAANDPYKKEGNSPPAMVMLTAEQEAEILKDTKVADDFDVTVFAAPPMFVERTQEHGIDDIVSAAVASVAAVLEWAVGHELFPAATSLEELKEEELAVASRRRILVPFSVEASAADVQRPWLDSSPCWVSAWLC